jgi:hypothetical protein
VEGDCIKVYSWERRFAAAILGKHWPWAGMNWDVEDLSERYETRLKMADGYYLRGYPMAKGQRREATLPSPFGGARVPIHQMRIIGDCR